MPTNGIGTITAVSRSIRRAALPALALALLLPGAAHADFSDGYKFLESVKKKEGDKVEQALMESSQIINSRDVTSGENALHIVTSRRDMTWLSYLIAHGANVNLLDDHGVSPLQLAVNLGWREGAIYLVEHGARTDNSNDAGETPLITAVHRHDVELTKVLLQAGADPDRSDNSGRSARDYAKLDGSTQILSTIDTFAKKGAGKAKSTYGPVL